MKRLYIISISLLLWGCMGQQHHDDSNEIKLVENVLQELMEYDNNSNLEGVMSCYTENAILMSPLAPSIEGHSNIENHYSKLFQNFTFEELKAIPLKTEVQGNLATISGINHGKIISKKDSSSTQIHGKFVMLFSKQDGKWKISRLIWNDAGSMENLSN